MCRGEVWCRGKREQRRKEKKEKEQVRRAVG